MSLDKEILDALTEDINKKGAPNYEKNIRSKMSGYNLIIKFPTCPDPKKKIITFPAYITSVDDNFSLEYTPEKIYGRMDPIPIYNGTTRTISFSLDIPSNGLIQSRVIREKLDTLVKNVYPSYEPSSNNVKIISSPPLASIFFSNLIYDPNKENSPLLGYFNGAITIKHDLSKGVFTRGGGFETYPRFYNLQFSFSVLHSFTPGFDRVNGNKNPIGILGAK